MPPSGGDFLGILARRRKAPLPPPGGLLDSLEPASAQATRTAYRSDWEFFCAWCEENKVSPLPASGALIAEYLVALRTAGHKLASIHRALTTICSAHRLAGYNPPRSDAHIREALLRLRKDMGEAQQGKDALSLAEVRMAVETIQGDELKAKLERAVLLVGWWGAMRRSEVVALHVDDVDFLPEGLRIAIRSSKTDQTGKGAWIGLPYTTDASVCPVKALRDWLDSTGIREGYLFRTVVGRKQKVRGRLDRQGRWVARLVQRLALHIGLDPSRFSGHSLRADRCDSAASRNSLIAPLIADDWNVRTRNGGTSPPGR